ncbi:MAG: ferredoxin, partial [Bacteroidaceae bacterium]|nr:ferredoxin [Bacteroidaceae bacterium]
MLRKIRITLATVFWLLVTWLLVDFTGTAHVYLGWMAKVQLMPALLSLNVGVLIFLLALTLLWGRIYCSV